MSICSMIRIPRCPGRRCWNFGLKHSKRLRMKIWGFHLAKHADIGSFDVIFYLLATSARLSQSQRLIHDSTIVELTTEGPTAVFHHWRPGGLPLAMHSAGFVITQRGPAGSVPIVFSAGPSL